jgi:putative membrane protein
MAVEQAQVSASQGSRKSIVEAWKESSRPQRAMLIIIGVFYLSMIVTLLFTWARHKPPLRPELVGFAMLSMLVIMIWHSWMVKGPRQTVAFFLIAWVISWFCEFIGDNYAWFFGRYKYTDTLGPRVGGVPLVIIVTWALVIYSAFMLIDWLLGLRGEKRTRSWWGRTLWSLLMAATTATLVCAWDMMVDPFATSKVWQIGANKAAWWWWTRGPYLKELKVWKGAGGVPIGNFVGWWLAPFFIVFIFYMIFQKPNLISDKLVNAAPLLVYAYIFISVVGVVLEMNWFENGMTEVALIGFFTMMPIILTSTVKLVKDYT